MIHCIRGLQEDGLHLSHFIPESAVSARRDSLHLVVCLYLRKYFASSVSLININGEDDVSLRRKRKLVSWLKGNKGSKQKEKQLVEGIRGEENLLK